MSRNGASKVPLTKAHHDGRPSPAWAGNLRQTRYFQFGFGLIVTPAAIAAASAIVCLPEPVKLMSWFHPASNAIRIS